MKRGRKTVLLLAGLIMMVAAYFGVQQLNQKQSVSELSGTFDLTAKKTEDLTGLGWTRDGTSMAFMLKNGEWITTDQTAWPVDQEILKDLGETIVSLQATRKLENISNFSDYGLEAPPVTVTAGWKDGTSTTYNMGDATPFEDGYYLSVSGKGDVIYIISSSLSDLFNKTQAQLVAMEDIPTVAEVKEISIGNSFHAVRFTESLTVNPDQLWYDAETNKPLENSAIETWISQVKTISWNGWVAVNPDETTLQDWRLDDVQAISVTLKGNDEGNKTSILFGAQNENGDYYARLPDSSMVYTVSGEKAGSLLSMSSDQLRISTILPLPYDYLRSAALSSQKGIYSFNSFEQEEISDSFSEEETETDFDAEKDLSEDPDATEEAQKELWDKITALESAEEVKDVESYAMGDPVLKIHAVAQNGVEITVAFFEYNADYYLATTDGGEAGLVSADQVDAIVRHVNSKL